ncbi:hypothetical protein R3P38DRAFT_2785929 [Favolaschia claudopus]|uniref:Uncharacterized protein n=1 Tax=Favolaschia claudopus TaxID=2862362 RepID=A0AAW0AUV1_9AGAR
MPLLEPHIRSQSSCISPLLNRLEQPRRRLQEKVAALVDTSSGDGEGALNLTSICCDGHSRKPEKRRKRGLMRLKQLRQRSETPSRGSEGDLEPERRESSLSNAAAWTVRRAGIEIRRKGTLGGSDNLEFAGVRVPSRRVVHVAANGGVPKCSLSFEAAEVPSSVRERSGTRLAQVGAAKTKAGKSDNKGREEEGHSECMNIQCLQSNQLKSSSMSAHFLPTLIQRNMGAAKRFALNLFVVGKGGGSAYTMEKEGSDVSPFHVKSSDDRKLQGFNSRKGACRSVRSLNGVNEMCYLLNTRYCKRVDALGSHQKELEGVVPQTAQDRERSEILAATVVIKSWKFKRKDSATANGVGNPRVNAFAVVVRFDGPVERVGEPGSNANIASGPPKSQQLCVLQSTAAVDLASATGALSLSLVVYKGSPTRPSGKFITLKALETVPRGRRRDPIENGSAEIPVKGSPEYGDRGDAFTLQAANGSRSATVASTEHQDLGTEMKRVEVEYGARRAAIEALERTSTVVLACELTNISQRDGGLAARSIWRLLVLLADEQGGAQGRNLVVGWERRQVEEYRTAREQPGGMVVRRRWRDGKRCRRQRAIMTRDVVTKRGTGRIEVSRCQRGREEAEHLASVVARQQKDLRSETIVSHALNDETREIGATAVKSDMGEATRGRGKGHPLDTNVLYIRKPIQLNPVAHCLDFCPFPSIPDVLNLEDKRTRERRDDSRSGRHLARHKGPAVTVTVGIVWRRENSKPKQRIGFALELFGVLEAQRRQRRAGVRTTTGSSAPLPDVVAVDRSTISPILPLQVEKRKRRIYELTDPRVAQVRSSVRNALGRDSRSQRSGDEIRRRRDVAKGRKQGIHNIHPARLDLYASPLSHVRLSLVDVGDAKQRKMKKQPEALRGSRKSSETASELQRPSKALRGGEGMGKRTRDKQGDR